MKNNFLLSPLSEEKEMSTEDHDSVSNNVDVSTEDFEFDEETTVSDGEVVQEDEIITLEGESVEKYGELEFITPEKAKILEAEAIAKERPVDYKYIEQMKNEGVTDELAVKAFIGRFGGNRTRTEFFLNGDFYYGSDAPTPLSRLRKAIIEDKIPECIEMLEGTKISLEYGDHF